jgi:DNA-directed RNA polymerase specialized sigma24 family protein
VNGDGFVGEEFAEWYEREHPRLVGALAWAVGDLDAVRDAVDEACARALVRWERVSHMQSPSGWVYRVAFNVWRRTRRRAALEHRLWRRGPPMATAIPGPAGEAWDLVGTLPERQRIAVALRYVADMTEAQIAQVMGVRRSTVSVLLRRAHDRLSDLLIIEDEASGEVMS